MKPWIRKALIALGGICAALFASYYWLIVESHMPSGAHYELSMAAVRRLAASPPGELPTAIEIERIGEFRFPATAVVAGDGWRLRDLPVYSYRIAYAHSSIIVDTALDQELGGENLTSFDAGAYARMQGAMSAATHIVITHEHLDHIGGLTNAPALPALLRAVSLTREQLSHPEVSAPAKFPAHALDGYVPLQYDKYLAIAPGVVLIKAPGHTPGSQTVFVAGADGQEFLLIGDIAWHFRNIDTGRERARLITWFILNEDRAAVFAELKALRELHETEPTLHMVPGHDGQVVDALIADGLLKSKFTVGMESPP